MDQNSSNQSWQQRAVAAEVEVQRLGQALATEKSARLAVEDRLRMASSLADRALQRLQGHITDGDRDRRGLAVVKAITARNGFLRG